MSNINNISHDVYDNIIFKFLNIRTIFKLSLTNKYFYDSLKDHKYNEVLKEYGRVNYKEIPHYIKHYIFFTLTGQELPAKKTLKGSIKLDIKKRNTIYNKYFINNLIYEYNNLCFTIINKPFQLYNDEFKIKNINMQNQEKNTDNKSTLKKGFYIDKSGYPYIYIHCNAYNSNNNRCIYLHNRTPQELFNIDNNLYHAFFKTRLYDLYQNPHF